MSVAKVIEITAESTKNFNDAIKQGVDAACKSVNNVQSAWVQDQKVMVKNGKVVSYRVAMKVTFVLDEK